MQKQPIIVGEESELPPQPPVVETALEEFILFPTFIYMARKPEFLDVVNEVSAEYIERMQAVQALDDVYPIYQTENYFNDGRLQDFTAFIGKTAWDILDNQGYDMSVFGLMYSGMWTQQHHKHSLMEEHVHSYGSVLCGFYFLECPENGCLATFHDPRPAKVISGLFEKDANNTTYASNAMRFKPEPGMLIFAPAWLSHSFSRNGSEEPVKFVHFNLNVAPIDLDKFNLTVKQ